MVPTNNWGAALCSKRLFRNDESILEIAGVHNGIITFVAEEKTGGGAHAVLISCQLPDGYVS